MPGTYPIAGEVCSANRRQSSPALKALLPVRRLASLFLLSNTDCPTLMLRFPTGLASWKKRQAPPIEKVRPSKGLCKAT